VSEIEQRLRAAMRTSVADEQPPAGLLEMVRLRRRRHRARAAWTAAGLAALTAAAVAALGLQAGALRAAPAPGGGAAASGRPAAPSPAAPTPMPPPGYNVVDDCAMAIGHAVPADWQRQSVQAGPLWFVGLRHLSTSAVKGSTARIGGLVVVIRNGATAWVTVVGQEYNYFSFLFGPGDFARGLDGQYSASDGESGVTFAGCPTSGASTYLPGFTQYGGYFLITVPRACVTLEVWPVTGGTPALVTFGVNGAWCPPS
jgi:hypothetical protein